MTLKLSKEEIEEYVQKMLAKSKKRGFRQTVELQIGLKDYDPKKDKRFSGTVPLAYECRPNIKLMLIGDAKHIEEAEALDTPIDTISIDALKKFNKNKKDIKKWAKKYDLILATDTLTRKIPKVLGPTLNKIQMAPLTVNQKVPLKNRIAELQSSVKFQLKKVLCMGVPIGHEGLSEEEIRQNLTTTLNFLVSLLKKGWNNVKTLHIKTTMGHSVKIFG